MTELKIQHWTEIGQLKLINIGYVIKGSEVFFGNICSESLSIFQWIQISKWLILVHSQEV